ncbi:MAG: hypothetical protein JRJ12_09850 [Deltaproteobacteria bacterium]|nr:hypothetical protein [Deltaproteobacteria bacterium]MBW2071308.1 hypothetical protein [Deltaproteobacteria bacterium]
MKKVLAGFCVFVLPFLISQIFFADTADAGYQITASVFSSGGVPMSSLSFAVTSTIGQHSPLLDQEDPPFSTTYDLYTGFWYILDYVGRRSGAGFLPAILLLLED